MDEAKEERVFPYATSVDGEWNEATAGGGRAKPTWRRNTQYHLQVQRETEVKLVLKLRGDAVPTSEYGFFVVRQARNQVGKLFRLDRRAIRGVTRFVSSGHTHIELTLEPHSRPFVVIPVTQEAGDFAAFKLCAYSDMPVRLEAVSEDGVHSATCRGQWSEALSNAGGCRHHVTWRSNPQYHLRLLAPGATKVALILSQGPDCDLDIGMYVAATATPSRRKLTLQKADLRAKTAFELKREVMTEVTLDARKDGGHPYVVMPCTYDPGEEGEFTLYAYADKPIAMEPLVETAPWHEVALQDVWAQGASHLYQNPTFMLNKHFELHVERATDAIIMLSQLVGDSCGFLSSIRLYVLDSSANAHRRVLFPTEEQIVARSELAPEWEVALHVHLTPERSPYMVVPCVGDAADDEDGSDELDVDFQMNVYSQHRVQLGQLSARHDWHKVTVASWWQGTTAGGCREYATWRDNPQYLLRLPAGGEASLVATLTQPDSPMHSIGLYLARIIDTSLPLRKIRLPNDALVARSQFNTANTVHLEAKLTGAPGTPFVLIPATKMPQLAGDFTLTVYTDHALDGGMSPILLDGEHGWERARVAGDWTAASAGGNDTLATWARNPQYAVTVAPEHAGSLFAILSQDGHASLHTLGLAVVSGGGDGDAAARVRAPTPLVAQSGYLAANEVSARVDFAAGEHTRLVIVPSTRNAGVVGKFTLSIYCTTPLKLTPLESSAEE